jgi:hypothetical protein
VLDERQINRGRPEEGTGVAAPLRFPDRQHLRFQSLSEEELRFILAHKWWEVGLTFSPDDYTDAEALAAIARITGGNLRLVQRLFSQIARVLAINRLRTITKELVEPARESLVIGP